ncbi:hypothetical protein MUO14_09905 [Halobacillus shinanisalinarum]|uniref:Uncharacterized protein n=1 Tax=Halobacillus shinanisalinarum TaxID=2932258 RepID=A0ABY4H4H3_9BACI|nr:hypothetical protein [Halobacillus shinanisalinarum]UOQ95206.1 hypothetical protein MUO14_09905 [Halobacillus shinanisalinarum]
MEPTTAATYAAFKKYNNDGVTGLSLMRFWLKEINGGRIHSNERGREIFHFRKGIDNVKNLILYK